LLVIASLQGTGEREPKTDARLYIAVEADANLDEVARRMEAAAHVVVRRIDPHLRGVEAAVPSDRLDETLAYLDAAPGVRYAEQVQQVATLDTPAEPFYGQQAGYLGAVNAPSAWNITTGSRDVIVAVVDTGIDVLHPDLAANIWFNQNETPNNGFDDDANGCVDDVNGCAFVTDSTIGCQNITNGFIRDGIGHGTFVAGVIAAAVNGQGIAGVARNVRVMPVKVLDCHGAGDSVAVARGIEYAARNGAHVINVSLGGLEEASVVNDAVAVAMAQHRAVVVAAAGNSGMSPVAFPARIPAVIGVGATRASSPDRRAEFSSYGPGIDVVAAGEHILGTVPAARCNKLVACFPDEPYGAADGTSFSAPQVSGLIALMLSLKPSLTAEQIVGIVRATATSLPPGDTPGWAGAGRINMLAALNSVRSNVPAGEPCTIASVEDGESFTCTNSRRVRMLQIEAPNPGECGGDWARAALSGIFLPAGRTVYLQYDSVRTDDDGGLLAAPIWRGNDGNDYNLSIVLLYVGLARAAEVGEGNVLHLDWARASENWARALGWNMWAAGKPFTGGC
jgi:subtilisin family serine protease